MKRLFWGVAIAIALVTLPAFAQPDSNTIIPPFLVPPREVSGPVKVIRPLNFRSANGDTASDGATDALRIMPPWGPAGPTIVLVGDERIYGKLADELQAFDGENVVVRGYDRINVIPGPIDPPPVVPFDAADGSDTSADPADPQVLPMPPPPWRVSEFHAQSFAPVAELKAQEAAAGEDLDYVTGVVHVEKETINIGKDRTTEVVKSVKIETFTGETFTITDEITKNKLAGLKKDGTPSGAADADGATLTLFGKMTPVTDPRALVAPNQFNFENKSARILVKGKLSPLFHIMGADSAEALAAADPATLTPSAQPMIAIWPPQDWADYGLTITNRNDGGSQKFFPVYAGQGLEIPQGALNGDHQRWVTLEVGEKKLVLKKISKEPIDFDPVLPPPVPLHGDGVGGTDVSLESDTATQPAGTATGSAGGGVLHGFNHDE